MVVTKNLKQDTKSFYRYICRKIKFRDKIGPLVDATGQLESREREMADMFNHYFVSVFSATSAINMDADAGDCGPTIGDVNVHRDVVLKYIQRMGQNKAPGADNIYPRVLKEVKADVVDALV